MLDQDMSLPTIAQRFFDTPLLIHPDKAQAIAWALRDKLGLNGLPNPPEHALQAVGTGLFGESLDRNTGYFINSGVAVIPVRGTLVNRGAWIGTHSGLMSYEGLSKQIELVSEDNRVRTVMLDIHSYGGEASGVDDLADEIRALDQVKPVHAMIDGWGTSAAYWIAAAARDVFIARSSYAGSIGVVLTHYDATGMAEKQGVLVTHIYAGKDKVLGSPWRSLSESDLSKLQAMVDSTYQAFVQGIADMRGVDPQQIIDTQAAVFNGQDLVERGLADGITTGRKLLDRLKEDGALNKTTTAQPEDHEAPDAIAKFASAEAADIYQRRREEAAKGQPAGDQRQHVDDHPTTAAQLDPDAVYRRRQQAQGNEPT